MPLPNDISRCPGDGCARRDTCQRFTDRDNRSALAHEFTAYHPPTCGAHIPVHPVGQGVESADESRFFNHA